jgi:prepilin-type N-terminal cleavage/methylation domain-containing protein
MLQHCLSKQSGQSARHAVLSRHGFLRCGRVAMPWVKCQQGFSLLEMLVVIGLIGIVAMGSATLLIDDGDWKRQDETVQRWDAIRKAIIGEPNLSLNGSPYVAGYVADMGRLPVSVAELIGRQVTYDHDNNSGTAKINRPFDHDNNSATTDITISQPSFAKVVLYKKTTATNCTSTPEDCYTLSGGWRGPYLYTAGSQFYRDGWNNQDNDANNDAFNFGWNITLTGSFPEVTDIAMHSLGFGNQVGGQETAEDFPLDANQSMVSQNEWTLRSPSIQFNVNFNKAVSALSSPVTLPPALSSGAHQLELRIYRFVDNGDSTLTFTSQDSDTDDVLMLDADDTFSLAEGNTSAPVQTVTPLDTTPVTPYPIGQYAAVIWCTNNTPTDYTDDAVYDGNCDTTFDHSPVYFSLTNSTTQVTITWNLP